MDSVGRQQERAERRSTGMFDLSPVGHPVWWSALALLLVNDNLLKGRGVLPGWLTGKLSDFAFLVVAPVLLTCLLPSRLWGRRTLAFSAISLVFAAADLSPAVSDTIVALAGRLGLRWRLWPDVTDLLAFAVLPLAWRVAGRRGDRVVRLAGGRALPGRALGTRPWVPKALESGHRFAQRVALLLGAFACLATSAPARWPHYPFFVNQTGRPQTVTLSWLLVTVDENTDPYALAEALTRGDLTDPQTVALSAGEVAPLDAPPADSSAIAGVCSTRFSRSGYTAALVSANDGSTVVMKAKRGWLEDDGGGAFISCEHVEHRSPCAKIMPSKSEPDDDSLGLYLSHGQLEFRAGKNVDFAPVDLAALMSRPVPDSSCREKQNEIHALIDGASSCASDADCQILNADIGIPGDGLCNVYVNRTLEVDTLAQAKTKWEFSCTSDPGFGCSANSAVQPAACRSGRCGQLCPGVNLPDCHWDDCTPAGLAPGHPCYREAGFECYASKGRHCSCASIEGPLVCEPPPSGTAGCPIGCLSDLPVAPKGSTIYMPGSVLPDAGTDVAPTDATGRWDGAPSEATTRDASARDGGSAGL